MKARAAVEVGTRTVEVQEFDVPEDFGPGALLKVEGNGLCGSDLETYFGRYEKIGLSKFPLIPGHEIVGRIVKITEQASDKWMVGEGQRVAVDTGIHCGICRNCARGYSYQCVRARHYGHIQLGTGHDLSGGCSDFVVVDLQSHVYLLPDHATVEDSVLWNPLANGFHWMAEAGNVQVGDTVLICGAGQRGLTAVIAAKEAGAAEIVLTGLGRDARKFPVALELGATRVVNVEEEALTDAVESPIDVALDVVPGSGQPIADAIELLRPHGRLVVAGVKGQPVQVPTDAVFSKELEIIGARGVSRRAIDNAIRLIGDGSYPLARLHSHTFGLDEVDTAMRVLANEVPGEHPLHITIRP